MEHTPDYLLVVVEESASHVGVYDPVTGLRRSTIKLGFLPHEIALSGDGKTAYVSNFGLQDYDETIGVPGYSVSIVDLERAVETGRLYTFSKVLTASNCAPHIASCSSTPKLANRSSSSTSTPAKSLGP